MVGLEQLDEAVELDQRLASRVADAGEARGGVRGVQPTRARLNDHYGQMMGDDVVQLTGDPRALAKHGELGERGLLGLESPVALGQLRDQPPARADQPSGGPRRHRDQQRGDDRAAGDRERQSEPGDSQHAERSDSRAPQARLTAQAASARSSSTVAAPGGGCAGRTRRRPRARG